MKENKNLELKDLNPKILLESLNIVYTLKSWPCESISKKFK